MLRQKIKNASKVLALLGLSLSLNAQAKDWDSVVIGSEGAYPPFNYFNSAGELVGFDIEIGQALCAEMKAKCSFVSQDWDGMIPALLSGKYDVILASMFITDERRRVVDFTDPYYRAATTFVAHKNGQVSDVSIGALQGKTIGALGSSTEAEYLHTNYPDSDIRLYRSHDELKLDMVNGRIDLMVGDLLPLLEWLDKSPDGKCCVQVGELITDPDYVGDGVGMAVRKEDAELRKKLNSALEKIVANGTYQAINDKYFSFNIYELK